MLLHGAHGSPLRSLVPAGKVGMWTTGDWGRTEHGSQDGIAAVGEAGLSYRFNEQVQLSLAVGGGNMRQYLSTTARARPSRPMSCPNCCGTWAARRCG